MKTNNKTLADAQPGGRVRLGDQPWPEIDAILADAYSAGATGLPFEGIARRHAVRAAVAALAAQPSPGGQDAARYERLFLSAVGMLTKISLRLGLEPNSDGVEPMLAAIDALAARQPVGEPVAWVPAKSFDKGIVAMTARRAPPSAMAVELHGEYVQLFAAPPAQAVDLDAMHAAACAAWDKHQQACRITTVSGSLRKVCEALIDSQAVQS